VTERHDSGPDPGRKADPEALTLRARPRTVARINRRVLIVLAAAGCALIFLATMLALDPPRFRDGEAGRELYNIDNKPTAEGLAGLPRSYGELPKAEPPELGPPLPGDLGGTILKTERELGVAPTPPPDLAFRPDPMEDALRAERLRMARKQEQAREAPVFFDISARPPDRAQAAEHPEGLAPAPAGPGPDTLPQTGRLDLDRADDPGLQGRKLEFLDAPVDPAIYNPHALQEPVSPYQVMAGTVIPASLITGINSDLPGTVIAQVTEHVYDSVTGRHLLIPQGSRLVGTYDSVVAFGQERALVVWRRIIRPDGSSIVIENWPATDTQGYAGLEDEVDFHTWRLLKGIVLSTLLGVGTELTFGEAESDLVRAIRESTQKNVSRAGERITERNLSIQPTITIRPGWPLRVIVNRDLVLGPYAG